MMYVLTRRTNLKRKERNLLIIVFHSGDEATGLFKSKIVPEGTGI